MKRLPLALLLASVALPLTATAAHAQTAAATPTLAAQSDGVDVTAGNAVKRRRQRAEMRMRRTVFLQQARQQRDRVRHEFALRTAELCQAAQP